MACQAAAPSADNSKSIFDPSTYKTEIQKLGKSWGKGLQTKDPKIFENLYDEKSHYLLDGEMAIRGNESIVAYWSEAMNFLSDIQLEMETLEGTRELLYETGKGKAMVLNQEGGTDTVFYKYVNVWKLQEDGSYKVVIDTYNDLADLEQ